MEERRMRLPAVATAALLTATAALTLAVRTTPLPPDAAVLAWVLGHRTPATAALAVAVTVTGSGAPAYLLAGVAGVVATGERRWRGVLVCELVLLAGQGVRLLLATWRHRPRPPAADWAGAASGWSFPSGHTTTSALVGALACVAVARRVRGRRRVLLQAAVLSWVTAVGLSRAYLAVHWATDVVGGWLLAGALVAVARLVFLRRRAGGPHRRPTGARRAPGVVG